MGSTDHRLVDTIIDNFKRRLQNEDFSSLTPSEEQQMRDVDTSTNEAMRAMWDEDVAPMEILDTMTVCAHCEEQTPAGTTTTLACGHEYCRSCVRSKFSLLIRMPEYRPPLCQAGESCMKPIEWTPGVMKILGRGVVAYVKRQEAMALMNQWASGRRLRLVQWQEKVRDDEGYESEVVHPKCAGCLEEIQSKNWATLSCEHDWCVECLNVNIRQAITSRANWPPRCCDYISMHDLEKALDLISEDLASELMEKEEELMSTNPTYCTLPGCGAFIPERDWDEDNQFGTCPLCQWSVCRRCKCPYVEHVRPGHHEFECPSRVGKENEKLIAEGAMQKCPECYCLVEKSDGCDHLKCHQCEADFCYRCGSALAGPFYRCRRECGGGAPAFEEEGEELEEEVEGPNPIELRTSIIGNDAEVAGVRLENGQEAGSEG